MVRNIRSCIYLASYRRQKNKVTFQLSYLHSPSYKNEDLVSTARCDAVCTPSIAPCGERQYVTEMIIASVAHSVHDLILDFIRWVGKVVLV